MKKFFSGIMGWVVIVIAALCIGSFIIWSRAPDMLANNLSKKLGVAVEIGDIELNLSHILVENFEIGNVPNGILPKAFSTEKLDVIAPLTRYFKDEIIIDTIQLDNVYLGLEFDSASSTTGNWTVIMSNLQGTIQEEEAYYGKTKNKAATENPSADSSAGKSLFINQLVINNISVDLVYVQGNGKIIKLPMIKQIILRNISSTEGFPMEQVMNSVLGQMLKEVFIEQNLKNMIQQLVPSPVKGVLSPLKGFFN